MISMLGSLTLGVFPAPPPWLSPRVDCGHRSMMSWSADAKGHPPHDQGVPSLSYSVGGGNAKNVSAAQIQQPNATLNHLLEAVRRQLWAGPSNLGASGGAPSN